MSGHVDWCMGNDTISFTEEMKVWNSPLCKIFKNQALENMISYSNFQKTLPWVNRSPDQLCRYASMYIWAQLKAPLFIFQEIKQVWGHWALDLLQAKEILQIWQLKCQTWHFCYYSCNHTKATESLSVCICPFLRILFTEGEVVVLYA